MQTNSVKAPPSPPAPPAPPSPPAAWRTGPPLHTARTGHGVATISGAVYAVGGMASTGQLLTSCEKFDPTADRTAWSTDVPDLPAVAGATPGRYLHALVALDGSLFAIGGSNKQGPLDDVVTFTGGVSWHAAPRLPAPRVDHGAAAFYAGARWFILVAGGTTGEGGGPPWSNRTDLFSDHEYAWSAPGSTAALLEPRQFPAVGAIGARVYVVGGASAEGVLDTVEAYDHAANKWASVAPAPTRIAGAAVGVLPVVARCNATAYPAQGCNVCAQCCEPYIPNGPTCDACVAAQCPGAASLLFVTGGYRIGPTVAPVAAVGEFDGSTWTSSVPPMAVARAYHGVAAVQNGTRIGTWELFAVGGSAKSSPTTNEGVLSSVEVYGVEW